MNEEESDLDNWRAFSRMRLTGDEDLGIKPYYYWGRAARTKTLWPWARKILRLWEEYDGVCQICYEKVPHPLKNWELLTQENQPSRDHIKPASLGGPNKHWNLQLAHKGCNSRRGNKHLDDVRANLEIHNADSQTD